QHDAICAARHPCDMSVREDARTIRCSDGIEIPATAARNRLPLMLPGHGQEIVVVKKAYQHRGRKFTRCDRGAGPHCRSHRKEIEFAELFGVVLLVEKFP